MHTDTNRIHIGLVNNMPASALEATDRQFRTLLAEATEGFPIHLSLFALPEIARSAHDKRRNGSHYSDIGSLWNSRLDGLIVTGAEPLTANLTDEPYWESLTKLLAWAEHNTYSSVWSCLAAHAAVLWLDGVARRPLGQKLFGVFECARNSDDPLSARLTSGIPERLRVPHSRWNGISADALEECGYRVLTRSEETGVDAFVKQRNSLFVFFQGHPEYGTDSLLLEYRRDVGRFLQRERDEYPLMPEGYFDANSAALLNDFRHRAVTGKNLLADFPSALLAAKLKNTWRAAAVCFYRNWLRYLVEQKKGGLKVVQNNGWPKNGNSQTAGTLLSRPAK